MPKHQDDVEALLEYLKRARGFDFSGYKRASLERRFNKRMQQVSVSSFGDYIDFLEVHPDEFNALFNSVLINVTSFFRDPAAWDYIANTIVPDILTRRDSGSAIRVWSAGCASGEEAYTLAMIFAEAMGAEAFKQNVKIYATDIDEDALGKGRQASYTERESAEVPPAMLAKYFELADGRHVFRKDLRRHVIFGRHDLMQDAPISRVDLLVCRNTLMYFNAEAQAKILQRFAFGLNERGVLFLGRAETLMTNGDAFAPLDLKRRVSMKVKDRGTQRERLIAAAQHVLGDDPEVSGESRSRLRDQALDSVPVAQLVIDASGALVLANERARALFSISANDVLRPLQDLKISYPPVELRSAIDQAYAERRPVMIRDVEVSSLAGESRWLDVQVTPLVDPMSNTMLGASVAFTDITAAKRLQRDLEHTNQELETAYEELQSTNEELETTNEELQSTNEELETMNEELQSTNEELHTINDELRLRSDELNQVNAFLENILTSLRGAVIVIDSDLKILVWNQGAEDLWGLREEELRGKNILGLDIGLATERLKQPIRACLSASKQHVSLTLDAVNRRGKPFICHIAVTPLVTRLKAIHGVIVAMYEQPADASGDGASGARKNGPTTKASRKSPAKHSNKPSGSRRSNS